MEQKLIDYGLYVSKLLACYGRSLAPEMPRFTIDWDILYKFADEHKVANILYTQLKKLNIPKPALEPFYKDYTSVAMRQVKNEYMAEQVYHRLEENKIEYVPLKGAEINKFYPTPNMRGSSDTDIYIKPQDRQRVKSVMADMGFTLKGTEHYHDVYHKQPIYNFEIHHQLLESSSHCYSYFKDYFSLSQPSQNNYHRSFDHNRLYIYTLFHLYKHYIEGGCGIRLFFDLYLLESSCTLNFGYIKSELLKIDLWDFCKRVQELNSILFLQKEYSKNNKILLSYIFASGIYGSYDFNVLSQIDVNKNFNKSKATFFLKAWFVPMDTMKESYHILNKAPFLLPLCYIHKGVSAVLFKKTAVKKQLKSIKYYDKAKAEYLKQIKKLSGITK